MNQRGLAFAFHPFRRPAETQALTVFGVGVPILVALFGTFVWIAIAASSIDRAFLYLGPVAAVAAGLLFYALVWLINRITDAVLPQGTMPHLIAALRGIELTAAQRTHLAAWVERAPARIKHSHLESIERQLCRLDKEPSAPHGISA